MKIKKITLNGFKRLGFGSIKSFTLDANNYCQLILGVNGFGKSMLLKEISPLPGNKNDYYLNGEKIVQIIYNDNLYTLSTTYKSSVKCSFFNNTTNTELNPGGTQAVQIELAKDIFGYTQDIHNLLHSKESFTDMPLKRRREWFIDVSNMNYDYAIKYWNTLRDRLRDIQGTIKENKKRLTEESASILSKEEIDKINIEITNIEKEIDNYTKLIDTNNYQNKDYLFTTLSQYKESLISLSKSLIDSIIESNKLSILYSDYIKLSKETIVNTLESLLKDIQDKDTEIRLLTESINKDRKTYHNSIKHDKINPNKIKEELSFIEKTLNESAISQINLPTDRDRLTTLISQLVYFIHEKPLVVNYIPKDEYSKKQEYLSIKDKEIDSLRDNLQELRTHAKLLQDKKNNHLLACPNCHHEFIPGFNKEELESIITKGKNLSSIIKEKEKEVEDLRKEVVTINLTYDWLSRYTALNERFSDYKSLFDQIDRSSIKNAPEVVLKPFESYLQTLDQYLNRNTLISRQNELKSLLETIESLQSISLSDYEKEIQNKENRLSTLYKEKETLSKKRSILQEVNRVIYSEIPDKSSKIKQLLIDFDNKELEYLKIISSESILKIVNDLKVSLGDKIKVSRNIESKLQIVEYITKEIDNLSKKEYVFKLLVDELSPQKGLIAEGLKEFIKVFLSNMNTLIKQIWSYPLLVNLPDTDQDTQELTFKFPMQVGLNDECIEDVVLGSSGIKEVINLSFKITAMKSLKLEHYPLFLDEFGSSFDQNHRVNAVNVIKNITDERLHSQLFMVSHYESSYGALPNCDVCLLSKEITSPYLNSETINNHVSIIEGSYNE